MADAEWIEEPSKETVTIAVILRNGTQMTRRASRDEAVGLAHLFRTRDLSVPTTGTLVSSHGVMMLNMDDVATIDIAETNRGKAVQLLKEIDVP